MKKHDMVLVVAPLAMVASNATAQHSPQSENVAQMAPASAAQEQNETAVMSMEELGEMRGGTQIAINNQLLNAENTDNNINGDFTAGDVNLADNAFSSFSGLGNFVFNTGAQSSLQAGMSVTINIGE